MLSMHVCEPCCTDLGCLPALQLSSALHAIKERDALLRQFMTNGPCSECPLGSPCCSQGPLRFGRITERDAALLLLLTTAQRAGTIAAPLLQPRATPRWTPSRSEMWQMRRAPRRPAAHSPGAHVGWNHGLLFKAFGCIRASVVTIRLCGCWQTDQLPYLPPHG